MSARSITRSKAGTDYIEKYLKTNIYNGLLHILNSTGDSLYHISGTEILDDVNLFLPPLSGDDTIATQNTNNEFGGVQTFNQGMVSQGGLLLLPDPLGQLEDDIVITDSLNITVGENQGTTIATSPSQMLAFFGATPVIQQTAGSSSSAGTASVNIFDLWDSLVTLGLISGPLSSGFQDVTESAAPTNPPSGTRRVYVDSTSHAFSSLDNTGIVHSLEGSTSNPNLVFNNQNNAFGAFYEELTEIVKPASPASGTRRLYVDSTSHALSALDSAGVIHSLEGGGGGGGSGPLPSLIGGRWGLFQGASTTPAGQGLLTQLSTTTGIGTVASTFINNRLATNFPSGTSSGNAGGFRTTNPIVTPSLNPTVTAKVTMSTNTTSRLMLGFSSSSTLNTNGFNHTLDTLSGFMIGFGSGDTNYSIITNNGNATESGSTGNNTSAVIQTAGTAAIFKLSWNNATTTLTWSVQTGPSTTTTGTVNTGNLPASGTQLYFVCTCQTNASSSVALAVEDVELSITDSALF
jgi:hypothetical protein